MWVDSETATDYLNFLSVADSVVELIEQADRKPLSIGVSGAWGVGKSSLVIQTREALRQHDLETAIAKGAGLEDFKPKYVFVSFNAWLYQGYDDARAALLGAIASELTRVADERKTVTDSVKEFASRVNWLRLAGLTAGSAAALAFGLPPIGLLGELASWGKRAKNKGVSGELIDEGEALAARIAAETDGLWKEKESSEPSPQQQIQALRDSFEAALCELDVTLVVFVDDLDRCLPETAVSTLEAIRLFLFLPGTAFVIAADDQMIKHAVRKHFDGATDDLVANYFDKLIQVPIRVPTLGTQEVRGYMFLLYVEGSSLPEEDKERIRVAICRQLQESWKGKRVDREFVSSLGVTLPPDLVPQLDTAERLTKLMTSPKIAGNPRLIKRFLNALAVRMGVARRQGIAVDEQVLAKLMLFERLAPTELYNQLAAAINNSPDGKPTFLAALEPAKEAATHEVESGNGSEGGSTHDDATTAKREPGDTTFASADSKVTAGWHDEFVREWLALEPRLSDIDMRGAMYVSREHLPVITEDAAMSAAAAEVLEALVREPALASSLRSQISALVPSDKQRILDSLLEIARRADEWGSQPILVALIEVASGSPQLESQLAGFIRSVPASQIRAAIVPRIVECAWGEEILDLWLEDPEIAGSVKTSIASQRTK